METKDNSQVGELYNSGHPQQVHHERVIFAPERPATLRIQWVKNIPQGIQTPDVSQVERIVLQNTVPTNITNFINGQNGQHILVLGDGFSTVAGGRIFTTTGTAKLLAANTVYHFTLFGKNWYQSGV